MLFEDIIASVHNQMFLFARIMVAGLCGALIGAERSRRQKEAGIRTHILVTIGAAMAVIISKYGFFDVVVYNSVQLDASRIASNVMTGIGFLGAGMIFVKGGSIKGLTTAAGIWTTAAVGMAIGAGLYIIGIFATLLILIIQICLKNFIALFEGNASDSMEVTLDDDPEVLQTFLQQLNNHKIKVVSTEVRKQCDGTVNMLLSVRLTKSASLEETISFMKENEHIKSLVM